MKQQCGYRASVTALLTIIALFQPALVGDVTFEAETLEFSQGELRAEGPLTLTAGQTRIRGDSLRFIQDHGCSSRSILIDNPKAHWGNDIEMRAEKAQICLKTKAVKLSDVRLRGPRLNVTGEKVTATLGKLRLDVSRGSFSRCDCQDPPWKVQFDAAEINTDGTWVDWPVLRLGPLPVLSVPTWYAPSGQRRSGFLTPSIGWRRHTGFSYEQPIYWAINSESDATITAGTRGGTTAVARTEGRWLGHRDRVNQVNVDLIGRDVRGYGQVLHSLGPVSIRAHGEALSSPTLRHSFVDTWRERRIADTSLNARVGVQGATYGADAAMNIAQTARPQEQDAPVRWLESVWIWSPDLPWAEARIDGRALYGQDANGVNYRLLDTGGQVELPTWLGPLQLIPYLGGGLGAYGHDISGLEASNYASAGAVASITWQRAMASSGHQFSVLADTHWTRSYTTGPAVDPWMRRGHLNVHGISIKNVLSSSGLYGALQIRQGIRSNETLLRLDPVGVDGILSSRILRTRWLSQGLGFLWGQLDVGEPDGFQVGLGYAKIMDYERVPVWAQWRDGSRHGLFSPLTDDTHTLGPRIQHKLGPLELAYAGAIDVNQGILIGQSGQIRWSGRCRCWSTELSAQWDHSKETPDIFLRVDLGAP